MTASDETALAKVIDLEVWARVHLPKLIEENRGDPKRLLDRFRDINKMLVKDLREVQELLDPVKKPGLQEIKREVVKATLWEGGKPVRVVEPGETVFAKGDGSGLQALPAEPVVFLSGMTVEEQPTIKVNGVEMVSVGCESRANDDLLRLNMEAHRAANNRIKQEKEFQDSAFDQPETDGTPVWIWSVREDAPAMFEDFQDANYLLEIRVPVGWSLASRCKGGTVLRNVFREEVPAFKARELALKGEQGFRLIERTVL